MHGRHSCDLHRRGRFATFTAARRCGRRRRGVGGCCSLLSCGLIADCACLWLDRLFSCCAGGCLTGLRGCGLGCCAGNFLGRSLRLLAVLLYSLRQMSRHQHTGIEPLSLRCRDGNALGQGYIALWLCFAGLLRRISHCWPSSTLSTTHVLTPHATQLCRFKAATAAAETSTPHPESKSDVCRIASLVLQHGPDEAGVNVGELGRQHLSVRRRRRRRALRLFLACTVLRVSDHDCLATMKRHIGTAQHHGGTCSSVQATTPRGPSLLVNVQLSSCQPSHDDARGWCWHWASRSHQRGAATRAPMMLQAASLSRARCTLRCCPLLHTGSRRCVSRSHMFAFLHFWHDA